MKNKSTSQASEQWEKMTEEEKTDWIANNVMGWTIDITGKKPRYCRPLRGGSVESWDFDPLHDWNHWRGVEEKVMEDEKLMSAYLDFIDGTSVGYAQLSDGTLTMVNKVMKADLPTRAKALYLAMQS